MVSNLLLGKTYYTKRVTYFSSDFNIALFNMVHLLFMHLPTSKKGEQFYTKEA